MTIQGWVLFGILALFILSFGIFGAIIFEKIVWKVLGIVAAMLLIIGLFAGMRWYYQNKLKARYPDGFSTEQSLHRSANDI